MNSNRTFYNILHTIEKNVLPLHPPKSNGEIYYFFICMNKFGVFKNVLCRELSIIVARCMSVFYPPPRTFVDNTEFCLCTLSAGEGTFRCVPMRHGRVVVIRLLGCRLFRDSIYK